MNADVSPASAERVRVAVVDDDTLIREGLRTLATSLEVVDVYPTAAVRDAFGLAFQHPRTPAGPRHFPGCRGQGEAVKL